MKTTFIDRVITSKKSPICVSLNIELENVPMFIRKHAFDDGVSPFKGAADAVLGYTKKIIDVLAPVVTAVSLNKAYYDVFGPDGFNAYVDVVNYARSKELLVIADDCLSGGKAVSKLMSRSYLGEMQFVGEKEFVMPLYDVDAVTLNPYFGGNVLKPFLKEALDYSKGVFLQVNSKNPLVGDIQRLDIEGGLVVSDIVAHYTESFGADYILDNGFSLLSAIFSPASGFESKKMRETMPDSLFLIKDVDSENMDFYFDSLCLDGSGSLLHINTVMTAYQNIDEYDELSFEIAARVECSKFVSCLQKNV